MSILLAPKKISEAPLDGVFVIYGKPGTGKTTLAATFPKTKEKPMLYLDILEGGTISINPSDRENIHLIDGIRTLDDLDEVLTAVYDGYVLDPKGNQVPVQYSTIVIDSASQLEVILKKEFKEEAGKKTMNLNLWGKVRESEDFIYNLCKALHMKTGALVVVLAHERELSNEKAPEQAKVIPSITINSAFYLCANASFVWYTTVEGEVTIDPKTQTGIKTPAFITYIAEDDYFLSKCRRPKGFQVPTKVKNLNFDLFKKNIMDKIVQYGRQNPGTKKTV